MKNIAVVLSGCGVFDGAEISESVLTLLAIDCQGAKYKCMAPNVMQHHVINHLTQQPVENVSRNVLEESARIARGDIIDIKDVDINNFDAAIFPGGFGAAKNLCDFAIKGTECAIQQDVAEFIKNMRTANKPQGFICIAPALIPQLFPKNIKLTIGNDKDTAENLNKMGAKHQEAKVSEIVVDKENKLVTTPAYMLANSISEANAGINLLVKEILALAK
jgi:enhancing lycopene biosynthesis protein 2